MLKRFLYILAVAFALQMSWGIASAYCLHETGKASLHFGHHQHEHKTSKDTCCGSSSSSSKKSAVHLDCPSCSHGLVGMITWASNFEEPLTAIHSPPLLVRALPPPYPELPERPQWHVAA